MTAPSVRLHLSSLRRLAWSRWGVMFALTGVAGIALRVWTYRSTLGIPDSDEAVVGLMARHIVHGQISTFFWGQTYGGSQEAMLVVPGFVIAGSSWLTLRMVSIVLSAVAAILVWRVGRRTIGEPAAGVAAAVYWIWPPFVIFRLVHQWGFYGSGVVYCGLVLLLALRVVERPDRTRVGLFGLVLGLAFWQTAQIVPIAVPVIAWTIWKQPRCLRQLWVAVPLAVLGSLPWLIWNVNHSWGSFDSPIDNTTTYAHRLRIFTSPLMPMMVGLRTPFSQRLLLPAVLTFLIYVGLLALFGYGAFRARRRSASLLYLIPVVFPFLYAISPQTLNAGEPRYLVILSPVLVLLFAQVATSYSRAIAVLALACVLSVVTLHRMDTFARSAPPEPPMAPRNLGPLISTLDRLHLDRVYANFWVAYVLTFDTRERIIAVQNKFTDLTFEGGQAIASRDPFVRWPPYEREVEAARHGFVFFRRSVPTTRIIPQLERYGYRRYVVGQFVIYAPPLTSVTP